MKKTPIPPTNPKRKLRVKTVVWGPPGYREHVVTRPCAVRGCMNHDIEPHHQPTRAAGGTWRDLIPLCGFHHTKGGPAVHRLGASSFAERFNVDWDAAKKEVYALWRDRTELST